MVAPQENPVGGLGERDTGGAVLGGSRPGWGGKGCFVINRQGGYFIGVEKFSCPSLMQD